MTRAQLLDLGLTADAINHRLRRGRLFSVHRGVYSVGAPRITRYGKWMAAVLACGPSSVLSDESAAALLGIRDRENRIEVSVPPATRRRVDGIVVHQRALEARDITRRAGIPVTTPTCTLIDLAARLPENELEAAVSEADSLGLVALDRLRAELDKLSYRRGAPALRALLDRDTFRLTDSELERRFLRIVKKAGLPVPETQVWLNGFRVDFFWPELGLVVEADGLRYHRTPARQRRDHLRDQTHLAAGLTPLRFTHAQVAFERDYVIRTLASVRARLQRDRAAAPPRGRGRSQRGPAPAA